jgi:hypothetical protein
MQRRGRHATLFTAAAVPFLVLAAWHWQYGPLAVFGDWAQYMLHADALLHGRPYADIGYIFTARNPFIGPPVQPIGLPLALVPVLAITDGARDGVPYKLLMVGFALAFLAMATAYFSRLDSRPLAVAAAMLTGVWLEVGFVTNVVQPDVGFCAFVWGTLYLADRPGAWSWKRVAGVTVLALAAFAFRYAALPIFAALGLYALVHWRTKGARPLLPAIIGCVAVVVASVPAPDATTFARLVPRESHALLRTVIEAASVYPFATLELFLYPFPGNRANDAYHVVIAAITLVGAVAWLRRAPTRLLTIFAVVYVGMLLVLPMQDTRYLMPLAPLVLYAAAGGVALVAMWVSGRLGRPMSEHRSHWLAVLTFVVIATATLGQELRRPRPPILMDATGMRSLFDRLRAEHAAAPIRAVFMNPRVLTWRTGVPAMGFFLAPPDTTLAVLRAHRITHVVVGDLGTDASRAASLQAAVTARPDAFRPLFTEGVFTVYRVDLSRPPAP